MERETKLDIIELARGYLGVFLLAILMSTGVISAYYPGEETTIPNDMGIDNLVYTIINNSTVVNELDIKINSTNITIGFPQDMSPDSFTIVFLENVTYEVIKTIKSGGGSSRTKYVDRNVTIYVPEYINDTIEVEVEKIIEVPADNIIVPEKEFVLWHVLLAMLCGGLFVWFVFRSEKE